MKPHFKHLLATTTLALSLGAQALTITPQAPTVGLAPGGEAVARFDLDFGSDVLKILSLQVDFAFDPTLFATGPASSITFTFDGPTPEFSLGDFLAADHAGGATISWILVSGLPEVSGTGTLSITLADKGTSLLAATPLKATFLLSTLDDELAAEAMLSVVPIPVPEPATWALALIGGCLLIAVRRST